ncbi:MAG: zinc ribbon domain-containing protein, partial [Candidatus Methanofastidiosa archaeon]|nr:zinc ribbon domain-containing protein [Candidatus Methanofastidiosa archaeon]
MRKTQLFKITIIFLILMFCSLSPCAADVDFNVQRQDVEINIYEDWSVEIWYYLTIETTLGPHNGIYLGIPDSNISDFGASVGNEMLKVEKTTYNGGDVLKIYFPETKYSGDITDMKVSFWAYDRLFPDQTNDEYIGMFFIPATWQGRTIPDQSITYILPEGVSANEVKFVPNPDSIFEDDRTSIYFEEFYATPESFDTNVLFPKAYLVPEDEKRENPSSGGGGGSSTSFFFMIAAAIFLFVIVIIIIGVIMGLKKGKKKYVSPELAMESLGVRKDLDNVEAAVVLGSDPIKVINLMVLGIVKKGLGVVESWGPLTMTIQKEEKDEKALKCPNCGAPLASGVDKQKCDYCGSEVELRGRPTHYENQFMLHALKK